MEVGKKPLVKVVVCCLLAIWGVFTLFPIYWTVVTSVKTPFVYSITPTLLPFVDFQPASERWLTMFRVGTESTARAAERYSSPGTACWQPWAGLLEPRC